ncbi:glycoside hydrolase family 128 [Lecanosticta acicola]|uniref:Glycoside hydrolase family 128 n=1 Tax=Lecanosticta acicola TaxID=111012 RepID=A0AAI8YUZ0_9PEZI|nr:glycoside hydrolase family 128 [Lecanosticta acicola]
MSPMSQLSILAFASTVLASPYGHGHAHGHKHLHTGTAPYPVPSGNSTGIWGSTGIPTQQSAAPTAADQTTGFETLYSTVNVNYASGSGASVGAAAEETSAAQCGADVTVTSTEKVYVTVTGGQASSAPVSAAEASSSKPATTVHVTQTYTAPGSYGGNSSAAAPVSSSSAAPSAPAYSAPASSSVASSSSEAAPVSSSSSAAPVSSSSSAAPVSTSSPAAPVSSSSSAAPVSSSSSAAAYSPPAYSATSQSSEAAPVSSSAAASSAPASSSAAAPTSTLSSSSSSSSSAAAILPTLTYSIADKGVDSTASATSSAPASYSSSSSSSSGKRGLGYNDASLLTCFEGSSEISWAYNWEAVSKGLTGFTYIPTLWGDSDTWTSSWSEDAKSAISSGSTHLFSFNEPDLAAQSNLSPAAAAAAYKTYMNPLSGQAKLCAPSVTNGVGTDAAPMGIPWLKEFNSACGGACKIDCYNFHWYDSASNIDYFKEYVNNATSLADGKPIFISEFGATGSDDEINTFLETVMPWMDSNDNIAGYAYYMASSGLLVSGTEPSTYGSTYKSYTS